jgi:anti-anti-sigma factor
MGQQNRIETAQVGTTAVVTLYGEHDLATKPRLETVVAAVARPGASVVIDVTPASFIDSTVVGAVMYAAKNADVLAVVAPEGTPCRRLLAVVGIDVLARVCASQDQALRYVLEQAAARQDSAVAAQLEVADRELDTAWAAGEGVEEALARARELSKAVGREPSIEDAKLLVARSLQCSPSEAFQRLVAISQSQNLKLAELSRQLVERAAPIPHGRQPGDPLAHIGGDTHGPSPTTRPQGRARSR